MSEPELMQAALGSQCMNSSLYTFVTDWRLDMLLHLDMVKKEERTEKGALRDTCDESWILAPARIP